MAFSCAQFGSLVSNVASRQEAGVAVAASEGCDGGGHGPAHETIESARARPIVSQLAGAIVVVFWISHVAGRSPGQVHDQTFD